MQRISLGCLIVFLAGGAVLFAGGTQEKESEPMVLNWNLGTDPKTLDPGLNSVTNAGSIITNTHEGLVREQQGVLIPGMAESWDYSDGGSTVTFSIRRDARWSDGSPLNADDFVYSWKRAMDPATASSYSWIWEYSNVVGAYEAVTGEGALEDVGIRAVDDYTFEVKLITPTEYFAAMTAFWHFYPVKQSSVLEGLEGSWAKNPDLSVSNGPFTLDSYTIGDGLTLTKNPHYWNAGNVELDGLNVKFIDDQSTAYTAYQAGEFDFLVTVPPSEVPGLIAENPEFYVFPLMGTYFYNFNMDLEIWRDQRVRRALALAIDREAITEVLAVGHIPASGVVPPGFADHEGRDFFEAAGSYDIPKDESGVAEARRLLAEAGYPGGEGFPEFVVLYNTSENHKLVVEMMQEMWKTNLGITCTLENQEWAVFQGTRGEGEFQFSRGGWLTDFLDPMGILAIFQSGNSANWANFVNPEYDELVSRANRSIGGEHYEALYEAQDILMDELPIIPIYHYIDSMLSSPQVKNWTRSLLGPLDFSRASVER